MTERRRRRSRDVALVAVPVLALAFAGCGEETAYCVDQNDRVVENRYCDDQPLTGGYFWYYGAAAALSPGARVSGGDKVPTSNIGENVRRGGFGSTSGKTQASGVGRMISSRTGGG